MQAPPEQTRAQDAFPGLAQWGGSFHDWLQGRALRACLMNRVDEAASTVVETCLGDEETIWTARRMGG